MRLIEEEHQLGLVQIADLGQVLKQFRQQPQQETRIQSRFQDQLVCRQNADDAATAQIGPQQVVQFQGRFAEERLGAFPFQRQQRPLNRRHGLHADQAIFRRDLLAMLRNEPQQGAEIVEVEQQQPLIVRQPERDFKHAGLRVVDLQHASQQGRPDLADRGPHAMARIAEHVPEQDRTGLVGIAFDADLGDPLLDLLVHGPGHRQAGDVAFHVRHEHRHTHARKALRQHQ